MQILQFVIDIVLIILLVGCIGALFAGSDEIGSAGKKMAAVGALFVFVLLIGALSAVIIPPGNVGVVVVSGHTETETLGPGFHFRLPLIYQVNLLNTQVQVHEFKEIEAASSEYQTVKLTGVMNYHLDGANASDLFQRVGSEFASKIIDPAFNDYIKQVVPQYKVSDILAKRDDIRSRAKADLQANLNQYHIIVDDIYIANISFSAEYQAAIEAKQVAAQEVEKQRQVTEQVKQQAEQNRQQAQGAADAQRTAAQGQADANNTIAASISDPIIRWQAIQRLNDNVQIMLLPADNNLIIDTSKLTPKP
jgi:prohibitin 2